MSETLLRFLLDELETVRVLCGDPNCGAILEAPIEKLDHFFQAGRCRVCNSVMQSPQDNNLALLAKAIRGLKSATGVKVQFVLPARD